MRVRAARRDASARAATATRGPASRAASRRPAAAGRQRCATAGPTPRSSCLPRTVALNERADDHVVERLLAGSERPHDETDAQDDRRDPARKVAPTRAREADAPALERRDAQ